MKREFIKSYWITIIWYLTEKLINKNNPKVMVGGKAMVLATGELP